MNRGSRLRSRSALRAESCFNEAPIHESGKSRATSTPARPSPCFNEAPIHESGKSDATPSELAKIRLASMRPRFMNRGSPAP